MGSFSLEAWFRFARLGRSDAPAAPVEPQRVRLAPASDEAFLWLVDAKAPAPGPWKAARPFETPQVLLSLRSLATEVRSAECPGAWLILVDETAVGLISFKDAPEQACEIEIGYGLAAPWRGRGVARAALGLLIAEVQADPRITALTAQTESINVRSRRVLAHHGFQFVSRRRDPDVGVVDSWRLGLR